MQNPLEERPILLGLATPSLLAQAVALCRRAQAVEATDHPQELLAAAWPSCNHYKRRQELKY